MKIKLLLLFCVLYTHIYPQRYIGIDISRYQGDIKFEKLDTNIKFVIIKATEGVNLKDKKFDYNWANVFNAKQKIYRGAYHFFRPNKSGIEQAKFFLSTVKFQKNDIIPVIDVEKMCYSVYYTRVKTKRGKKIYYKNRRCVSVNSIMANHNLSDMVDYIHRHLKVKPIIYTTTSHWNSYYKKLFVDEHHHFLWVADYRKNVNNPIVPDCWETYHIHQYTPRGKFCGIPKRVDVNITKYHPSTFLIK